MTDEITKLATDALESLPIEEQIGAAEYLKHVLTAEKEKHDTLPDKNS